MNEALNNGYIGHRIEDRLGLDRGAVVTWGDDDGNVFATLRGGGELIPVMPEDEIPY